MDIIKFRSENLEYNIELRKRLKGFSYSQFGKYICSIIFKNNLDQVILQIDCTEKEYLQVLEGLNSFQMNIGNVFSDIMHFESSGDLRNYFWYVSNANLDESYLEETEDPKMQISIYESYMNNNVLRIYLEMHYVALEDFVFNMYKLIEDIPYLNELTDSTFLEYMDYTGLNMPD